jgi:hypothetical protein
MKNVNSFSQIFPDLYQPACVGVVYESGNVVKFSPLHKTTIIITGPNPHAFLCEMGDIKGLPAEWPDQIETRNNTDGSISAWFK